jgi:hypothetical protein
MNITFLEAAVPLTKTYFLGTDNKIDKHAYPNIKHFTSHEEQCATLSDFYTAVKKHAALGHCLLKGQLDMPLINESRAGHTSSDAASDWVCLDFDKADFDTVDAALACIPAMNDVSYIVQYSASHGLPGTKGLNCHVFVQLSHPRHAPYLKAWLMFLNLQVAELSSALTLCRDKSALSWSLDVTTCQNDKLLFITKPVLKDGIKSSLPEAERVQLIAKTLPHMPLERLTASNIDLSTMRKEAHKWKNKLRIDAGMEAQRSQPKLEGSSYVIVNPGEAHITSELRTANGFVSFNVNHGDSWSYFHPEENWEYIYCFKHLEERFRTREFLPSYYAVKEAERNALNASPTETGDILLAFNDFKSSTYWRGTWNHATQHLRIAQASNANQLNDWLLQHGRRELDFVPVWDIGFDPHNPNIVNVADKTINTYQPSPMMRMDYTTKREYFRKQGLSKIPMTIATIRSALGCIEGNAEDDALLEHFLNWLAVIYQCRVQTMTAWLLSGNEGTGKGVVINNVLTPTLGDSYVVHKEGSILEDSFNGWMERRLIVSLNEVDIVGSGMRGKIRDRLWHWITDPTMPIRNMRQASYDAKNFSNFIMSTNKLEGMHISDSDRRINVANYQPKALVYTTADIATITAENQAWMNYIMTRDANVNKAKTSIKGRAREQLVEVSITGNDTIAKALLKGNITPLLMDAPDMDVLVEIHGMNTGRASHYNSILQREAELIYAQREHKYPLIVRSKLTNAELGTVFEYLAGNTPMSPTKFGLFLKHRGIDTTMLRVKDKIARGIHVTWNVTEAQMEHVSAWLHPTPRIATSTAAPKKSSAVKKADLKLAK